MSDTKCKECGGKGGFDLINGREVPSIAWCVDMSHGRMCPECSGTGTSKEVVGEWPKKRPEHKEDGMAEDYYWDGYNKAIDDCLLAHTAIVAQIAEQREHELAEKDKEIAELKEKVFYHIGGEDDGYDGKTKPITWKEYAKDQDRYETWAMQEMKKACNKIKAHPKWEYGANAYPSPHERAIVAGCGQAIEEQHNEIARLRSALEKIVSFQYPQTHCVTIAKSALESK